MSDRNKITLSAPWDRIDTKDNGGNWGHNGDDWGPNAPEKPTSRTAKSLDGKATTATRFVEARSKVHDTYIREHNRTKRLGLIISAVMLVGSCCIIIFAPQGRELASYIIGAFLVLTAAGVAGFTAVKLKVPGVLLDARNKR